MRHKQYIEQLDKWFMRKTIASMVGCAVNSVNYWATKDVSPREYHANTLRNLASRLPRLPDDMPWEEALDDLLQALPTPPGKRTASSAEQLLWFRCSALARRLSVCELDMLSWAKGTGEPPLVVKAALCYLSQRCHT